jgi:TFIIF-interacting CTD phosphatase-like protein
MWTKLRPGVHSFLLGAARYYQLWIHTNGARAAASISARLRSCAARLLAAPACSRSGARSSACSATPPPTGNRAYADCVVRLLDPRGELFGDRIIAQVWRLPGDGRRGGSSWLSASLGVPCTVPAPP